MIYPYNIDNLNRWNRSEFKVQLNQPNNTRPMGYCDGTAEDEEELHAMAEMEQVDDMPIAKKYLKTGREIWTLGRPPSVEDYDNQ
ncbi:MAG: hypothetical protein ACI8RZ_002877 [Myxococcota bacterium]|jgi:hypothetical protein